MIRYYYNFFYPNSVIVLFYFKYDFYNDIMILNIILNIKYR